MIIYFLIIYIVSVAIGIGFAVWESHKIPYTIGDFVGVVSMMFVPFFNTFAIFYFVVNVLPKYINFLNKPLPWSKK